MTSSSSGLKRAGTLGGHHPPAAHTPSPPNGEEEFNEEQELVNPHEDESYYDSRSPQAAQQQYAVQSQGQYPGSPMGRSSPWSTPSIWEWQTAGGSFTPGTGNPDDLARALSNLDISHNIYVTNAGYQGQSIHPPRFHPNHPPPSLSPVMRLGNTHSPANTGSSRKLHLKTDADERKANTVQLGPGTGNIPGYAQAMGGQQQMHQSHTGSMSDTDRGASWEQRDKFLGQRTSNSNLNNRYSQGHKGNIPDVPPIPPQYLNQQSAQAPRMGNSQGQMPRDQSTPGYINSPVDVPSLIAGKGYNPSTFDIHPGFVRCLSLNDASS